MRSRRENWLVVFISVMAITEASSAAEFEPSVRLGLTHTDNIFLDTEEPLSEQVFHVEPMLRFWHESRRLNVDANYRFQSFWYKDLDDRSSFDQYNVDIEGAFVPDVLFLGVGADRIQSIADPAFNIPQGNLPISANRVDRDEYYAQPRLESTLGDFARLQAQYRYSHVEFERGQFQSSVNQNALLSVDNYQRGRGASLAVNYEWFDTEYENGIPWRYSRAMLELGFWTSARLRLFGGAGYESPWDEPLNDSLEAKVWELGFAYEGGERFSAEFAAGDRSFGRTWRATVNVKANLGSMVFSYSEDPATQALQRNREPDTRAEDISPSDDLTVPGATDRFIARRLNWLTTLELSKTTLTLNLFNVDRTDRTSATGVPLSDETFAGVILALGYELGSKTNVRLSASFSTREFAPLDSSDQTDERDITRLLAAVDYQLGARTTATLEYRYNEETPSSSSLIRGYEANSVGLYLDWAY